ncbi:MAG TPA: hypothetical protein VL995_21050 [Cellvibrio sp.]|nr:hypothetical protein [Cellvibrio sp.]
MKSPDEISAPVITVNGNAMTFTARHNGKTATCTYSAQVAAERVCEKLWPEKSCEVKEISSKSFSGTSKTKSEFSVRFIGGDQ